MWLLSESHCFQFGRRCDLYMKLFLKLKCIKVHWSVNELLLIIFISFNPVFKSVIDSKQFNTRLYEIFTFFNRHLFSSNHKSLWEHGLQGIMGNVVYML